MRITRLLYGNDVNILLSVPALLFLLQAFYIALRKPTNVTPSNRHELRDSYL